jgi:uncharacterized membrane protein (DUF2068 family)
VDTNNQFIEALLLKLELVNAKQLQDLCVGSFFYAALELTEGGGLALRKPWAEYFTILVTASFLPLEIYEMTDGVTVVKIAATAVNVAILGYLIWRVKQQHKKAA